MFGIVFLYCLAAGSVVDPTLFQLGNNIVKNYNFMDPSVTNEKLMTASLTDWNCSPDCQMVNTAKRCVAKGNTCSVSFAQAIDLDQDDSNFSMAQGIQITSEGAYLLRMTYMPPAKNPIGKAVFIKINGTQVATFNSTDANYIDHVYEVILNLTAGTATLALNKGGIVDNFGVELGIVELRELIPVVSASELLGPVAEVNYPLLDNFTKIVNKFPGNRIFL